MAIQICFEKPSFNGINVPVLTNDEIDRFLSEREILLRIELMVSMVFLGNPDLVYLMMIRRCILPSRKVSLVRVP